MMKGPQGRAKRIKGGSPYGLHHGGGREKKNLMFEPGITRITKGNPPAATREGGGLCKRKRSKKKDSRSSMDKCGAWQEMKSGPINTKQSKGRNKRSNNIRRWVGMT